MSIYVECKADTILIRTLLELSKKSIKHGKNKFEIIKLINNKSNKIIGIVDEDPGRAVPRCFNDYKLEYESQYDFIVYRSKNTNNILIIIKPELEGWIIYVAKQNKIDLKEYKLPTNAAKLKERINADPSIFVNLLQELKQYPQLQKLKQVILLELKN